MVTSTLPATIATYAGILAFMVENHEPVAWAEELIEPPVPSTTPGLRASMLSLRCPGWQGGVDDALTYVDAGMAMR